MEVKTAIAVVRPPPISNVLSWIEGRKFPTEKPLLDVAQAVPSYPPANALRNYLSDCAKQEDTALYTDIAGLSRLRQALAVHLSSDYGGNIKAEQIAITAGCNQAFCVAVDTLAGPGDEIIIPLPYYFNHHMWLTMRSIAPKYVPFHRNGPTAESIAPLITEKTRAIALTSPNNPTGLEYSPETITKIYDLAVEKNIALIVDETYKDFRSNPGPPHSVFQQDNWPENYIHLYSFSKAYALTGYRIGAITTNANFISHVEKVLDCLTICASHISQLAALYGLENLGSWKNTRAVETRDKMAYLKQSFQNQHLKYELVSSGAYFAYIKHPFSKSSDIVAEQLARQQNVLCLPGTMFGPEQQNYLRFAFANLQTHDIPELVERLILSQNHSTT